MRADVVGERDGRALVRNGEHQPVEILHALQLREATVEVGGSHVHGDHQCVDAAAHEFGRDHLGRAHLLDRIADDAVDARATRDEIDLVARAGRCRCRCSVGTAHVGHGSPPGSDSIAPPPVPPRGRGDRIRRAPLA